MTTTDGCNGSDKKSQAREIFLHALSQASVAGAFSRQVHCARGILRVCDDLYDLQAYSRVFVVSIGKAGHTMAEALTQIVGEGMIEGIVACPDDPPFQVRGFRYFRGGHPTPNAESVAAASAILRALNAQTAASLVIFLISGGGSSMVEMAMDVETSLDDLIATHRALVLSGAPIAEINAIRKHLSAVKGGRLARVAYPAQQVSLLVSDVPETALDALASGPTMPDSATEFDCYRIAEQYGLVPQFPESVRELFERRALEETPKSDDPAFVGARWWTVLSNHSVVETARAAAERAGYSVHVDNFCDDWEYARAAAYLLERLRDLRKSSARICLISGGEVTVKVTNGGVGGRNQQFVLECARNISGEDITVLSAGTDGVDGNSPAAGAVADGTTAERAQAKGFDISAALTKFDAYPLFKALADVIEIGPTGNNLRDLRVLLVE